MKAQHALPEIMMSFKANFDYNLTVQRSCNHACVGRFKLLVLRTFATAMGLYFCRLRTVSISVMLPALLKLLTGIGSNIMTESLYSVIMGLPML